MAKSSYLKFACPSCGEKLAGIEPFEVATQVVTRTCRKCGDRWQLVVKVVSARAGFRVDKAEIVFLDNRWMRNRS